MKNMSRQTSLYGILVVVGIFQTSVQSLKFYQNGNFECSTNGTLTCKSETLPVNSALYINGLTIVICEEGQCIVNPLTPSIYVVEHDYSKGVINVTVLSVSTNISNTLFRCDGDSTFMTIGPNINVTVTPSSFVVDVIQETENTSIQAVTGCAKPSTIFIFKWFMSKDNNWNGEVMTELTYKPFKTENDTYCHPEGHCNGTGIASTITFPTPAKDKREAYYVHCVVYVSDIPTVANTTTRLVWLPDTTSTTSTSTTSTTTTTTTTSTTTTQTTTATTTTETTTPASNTSSSTLSLSIITTLANPGKNESISWFFKKYKFEAIAIGCSLIVIIIAAVCVVLLYRRRVKNRKEHNIDRAMQFSNMDKYSTENHETDIRIGSGAEADRNPIPVGVLSKRNRKESFERLDRWK